LDRFLPTLRASFARFLPTFAPAFCSLFALSFLDILLTFCSTSGTAGMFNKQAGQAKRQQCIKNLKMQIALGLVRFHGTFRQ